MWSSSLTDRNDIERVQRSALTIILGQKYKSYKNSLIKLNLESLEERRESLCLRFVQKCTKNQRTQKMFPLRIKAHNMKTRNIENFKVQHANTERSKNSAIIYMPNLLNKHGN